MARKRKSKKIVLVTGGTGFIGSKLSNTLLQKGYAVVILTRTPAKQSAQILSKTGATIVKGDLVDRTSIEMLTTYGPFTAIFHLGANLQLQGHQMEATNIAGTENILKIAEESLSDTFVFASSIEAQGLTVDRSMPLTESDPCSPVSDYGQAKRKAEILVQEFSSFTGKRSVIARIGNVYGAGGMGFIGLLWRILFSENSADVMLQALPHIRHRWMQPIYVDDVVKALIAILDSEVDGIVNVTGSIPTTIENWLFMLAKILRVEQLAQFRLTQQGNDADMNTLLKHPEAWYFLARNGERQHRIFDDSKLCDAIGRYQNYTLLRGTAKTIAWMNERNNNATA